MTWTRRHARRTTRLLAAVIFPLLAAPAYGTAQRPCGGALEPRAPRSDVLILESGERMSGRLEACVGDRCQLDSSSVPLSTIVWIGFAQGDQQTPKVEDATHDELHLRDGSIKSGHLLGISLGVVALQEGSFDRSTSAWLHLGGRNEPPKLTAVAGQEAGDGQPPAPPAPAPPAPTPAPAPAPASGGASSGTAGGSAGGGHAVPPQPQWKRGGLWTGKAKAHLTWKNPDSDYKEEVDLRLREYRMTLHGVHGRLAGEAVNLVPEGSTVHEIYHGLSGDGGTCSGSGTATVTASGPVDSDVIFGGNIFSRAGDDEMALSFWPQIPSGPPVYGIWIVVPYEQTYTSTCTSPNGSVSSETNYETFDIGAWPWSPGKSSDIVLRRVEGGKMRGSYFADQRKPDWVESVSWSLCREGVQCSDPPELPGPTSNPCSDRDMKQAAAFVQQNRDRRTAKVAALAKAWGQYQAESQAATAHLADYRKTIAACAAWDVTMKVLEDLVGEGAGMGLSPPENATADEMAAFNEYKKQLGEFQDAVKTLSDLTEKVMNGEPPVVMPEGEASTLEWAVKEVEKILEITRAASPAGMAQQLDDCSAPVPDATFQSAQQLVAHLKASLDSLHDSAELRNDVRNLDDQLPNLEYKNWAACVEHARCAGTPESNCDHLKPAGDWPDVP